MLAGLMTTCQAETIHFTNSPTHLLGSRNITTYKLMVKNAEPITIIEANKGAGPSVEMAATLNRRGDDDINRKMFIETSGSESLDDIDKTISIEPQSLGMTITAGTKPPSDSDNRNTDSSDENGPKKLVYSPILLKKFVKEYTEKLKNADPSTQNAIKEISEKINQNGNTADSVESAKQDVPEEKYNYNQHDRRRPVSNSPYKDRDGWVTLEAVPWSTSTVSKWHGNRHHEDDRNRPGSYGITSVGGGSGSTFNDRVYSINSHRPGNNYHHEEEEEFYHPKPYGGSRPSLDDERPTYTAWSKPQAFGRPSRPHSYSSFNDHDDYFDRDHPYNSKPYGNSDIITDNRPSSFPRPNRRPNSGYDAEPYSNDDDNRYRPSSSDSQHPINGNGEWVLISTTKGYQMPGPGRRQNGRRALKFSVPTAMDTARDDITAHKSVKLTVLPPLKSNSTFSTDQKKMVTSHGGLLEVDSSQQTIEAAVHAAKKHSTKAPLKRPTKATNKDKKHKVVRGN